VYCSCPIEECLRRYEARAASRHSVHVLDREIRLAAGPVSSGGAAAPAVPVPVDEPLADRFARSAQPMRLGPVITVDTTRPVDVAALAASVQQLLAEQVAALSP
jgi:hypothetical protein